MTDICHAFHAILKICVDLPVSSKSTASASSFFSISKIQNHIWGLGHVKQYYPCNHAKSSNNMAESDIYLYDISV